MAVYTEPPAVVTGQVMTATNWNSWVRTNFQALWPFTLAGDLAYASAANQLNRLAIGASGAILQSNGSAPVWAYPTMRGARVTRTTTQSIANSSITAVSWNSEIFDTNNFWTGGSPTRFTIPRTGYYLMGAELSFYPHATGSRQLQINQNGLGATQKYDQNNMLSVGAVTNTHVFLSSLVYAAAGDYFEAMAWQNSGGALDLNSDDCIFWILDVGI